MAMGQRQPPVASKVWARGMVERKRSSAWMGKRSMPLTTSKTMLRWLSMTPLEWPVVPEV